MKLFTGLFVLCSLTRAQDIQLYSEFERFNPFGHPLAQDRDLSPREILSPAVPRNGHLTVHAVITAPAGTNYFVYLAANPPGILQLHLYREHYTRCGLDFCADWLSELRSPAFGAMPESRLELPSQTTRSYLVDIYVPPYVPPQRIRVEALLKTGTWLIAPIELRVIAPTVPATDSLPRADAVAPREAPSSDTALAQLLRYNAALPPTLPRSLLRVRDFIQRNAAEDLALASAARMRSPQLDFFMFTPLTPEGKGAEWYLRLRDYIYRNSVNAH